MTRLLLPSGIYTITNIANGHRYVGSAVDIDRRWSQHKSRLRGNGHHSIYLQRAWDTYGEDTFEFEVLERWGTEFLVGMEQWWMNMLQPEYNILPTAGSPLGYRHTKESLAKQSLAQMGRKHSDETKAKISAAHMGHSNFLGHKHTEETKAKMSAWQKGRTLTKEHKANISAAHKGKKRSAESRANMSSAQNKRWA